MVRGTTPRLKFSIPVEQNMVAVGYVTFQQAGQTVLEKDNASWEYSGKSLVIHLSQADTLKFNEDEVVEVQVRIRTTDGESLASDIKKTPAKRILKDGQI